MKASGLLERTSGRVLSLTAAAAMSVSLGAGSAWAQAQTWIAGTAVSPSDSIAQATDYFAERVTALTGGEIVIERHHGAALGGDRDLLESILQGAIQVATPGQALLSGWYPPAEVWTFPYLFDSIEHKDRVWDAIRDDYAAEVAAEAGLRPLVSVPRGPRQLTINRVVRTPADKQGLKIRVPETQMWMRSFEMFGASPTALPFPEVYQSLRAGIIDGQDNPIGLSWNSGFFEVNTHLSLTEHMMQDNVIVIGEAAYQALTDEQREAVQQAARETEAEFRNRLAETEAALLQRIRDAGVVVTEVDKEAFRQSVAGLEDEFPHIRKWVDRAREIE